MNLKIFLFFVCLTSTSLMHATPLALDVNAQAAILMNADTGVILFEKNARALHYPASVTKIATAIYVLNEAEDQLDNVITAQPDALASISEEARIKSNYTVPAYWHIPGGTHIGIKKDEQLPMRALLYGLLLESGNDAANVLAQHVSGTIPDFMKNLNAFIKKIGCKNTQFLNPHGLFHPNHQTTAYDVALIMREGLKNPNFREIISTVKYVRPKTNKQEASVMFQHNKLLRTGKHFYSKCIGGKTGYLSLAGSTLVAAAKHEGRTLIAVVFKCKEKSDRYDDVIKMFEAAFNQPKVQSQLFKKGPQKFILEIEGAVQPVSTYTKEDFTIEYYPAEEPQLRCLLYWKEVQPPVAKDQQVGEIHLLTADAKTFKRIPLFSQKEVAATLWWKVKHPFGK